MASRVARSRYVSFIGRSLAYHSSEIKSHYFDQVRSASNFSQNSRFGGSSGNSVSYQTTLMESIGKNHYSTKLEAFSNLGIMTDRIRSRYRRRRRKSRSPLQGKYMSPESSSVRVKSIHAAQTLNVINILSKVFGARSFFSAANHVFGKNSLIVQLRPTVNNGIDEVTPRYVAVYRFGSVVFLNVSPRDASTMLQSIKKHGTEPISPGFERDENFEVIVDPNLQEMDHVVNGDFCVVQKLDMNATAVISNIVAQSVALDSYSDIVDELLARFTAVNSSVTKTGNFTNMEKESLFRIVSQNNSVFIDLASKIGVKDRSDTAWRFSQYNHVHEGLLDEFEIEDRFQNLEFKLDLIQQNAKFFLEVLQSQKSNSLEWCIVVLILFECVLMIMEMSGLGETIFQDAVQSILPPK